MQLSFTQLKRMFLDILLGRHNSLPRSANLLHVLGSVTVSGIKTYIKKKRKCFSQYHRNDLEFVLNCVKIFH